jgi:hypothetical protein
LIGRVENLYFGVTFHALSNGIFSFQSQNFSAMSLGGDLVDALLSVVIIKRTFFVIDPG